MLQLVEGGRRVIGDPLHADLGEPANPPRSRPPGSDESPRASTCGSPALGIGFRTPAGISSRYRLGSPAGQPPATSIRTSARRLAGLGFFDLDVDAGTSSRSTSSGVRPSAASSARRVRRLRAAWARSTSMCSASSAAGGNDRHPAVGLHVHETTVRGDALLVAIRAHEADQPGDDRTDERAVAGEEGRVADTGAKDHGFDCPLRIRPLSGVTRRAGTRPSLSSPSRASGPSR